MVCLEEKETVQKKREKEHCRRRASFKETPEFPRLESG